MSTEAITPRPDDPASPTAGACCSFCGLPSNQQHPLVEAPNKSAYVCGKCALKSVHVVFAHKRTLSYKLIQGLTPFVSFIVLGLALAMYFAVEAPPLEPHIALGLVVLGVLAGHLIHYWWPDDDLLPRRPWF